MSTVDVGTLFDDERYPVYAPFFSIMGILSAMVFSSIGAAYGTAKSGVGIAAGAQLRPEGIMKSVVPVVMAGIIGIYGLVISVVLSQAIDSSLTVHKAFMHLAAGLACGVCGLGAGITIGVIGDAGARASSLQGSLFVTMILILIFSEVLGLYGLIIALIVGTKT